LDCSRWDLERRVLRFAQLNRLDTYPAATECSIRRKINDEHADVRIYYDDIGEAMNFTAGNKGQRRLRSIARRRFAKALRTTGISFRGVGCAAVAPSTVACTDGGRRDACQVRVEVVVDLPLLSRWVGNADRSAEPHSEGRAGREGVLT